MSRILAVALAVLLAVPGGYVGISIASSAGMAGLSSGSIGQALLNEAVASLAPPITAGVHWSQASTNRPVPHTYEGVMVYDGVDQYVVYFGGYLNSAVLPTSTTNQTWTFANNTWTLLHPPVAPVERGGASAIFDAKDGYVLLFGGSHQNGNYLSDTWSFRGGLWHRQVSPVHPLGRYGAAMAYDSTDQKVVLFGGQEPYRSANDTWVYSAGSWTRLFPSHPPSYRSRAMLADDPSDGGLLLFGGQGRNAVLNDTWTFNGTAWSPVSTPTAPPPTFGGGLVYDRNHGYDVLFGGWTGTAGTNATWRFHHGAWAQIALQSFAPTRWVFGMTYNAAQKAVQVTSGFGCSSAWPSGVCRDTWYLS